MMVLSSPEIADTDAARAHDALRDATLWDGHSPLKLRRASSDAHSNLTIEVRCDAGHFALRLPQQRSGGFIDRSDERRALNLAWRIGIGAEPIHIDPTTGIVVTRWIEDAAPISAQSLVSDALRLERAADMLARLHRSGDRFTRTRDPATVLAAYRAQLDDDDALWVASTEAALQVALLRMQIFATDAVASHGDAAPANFLDAPNRMRLIDWEYACMSDPAWDLGYLASEAEFDSAGVARLAGAYCDAEMTIERISAAALVAGAISLAWVALQMRAQPSLGMAETIAARRAAIDRLAMLNAEF